MDFSSVWTSYNHSRRIHLNYLNLFTAWRIARQTNINCSRCIIASYNIIILTYARRSGHPDSLHIQSFYLLKDYNGRENETRFIKHLEDNIDVKNWFKNGSHGKDSFCIKYFKTDEQVFDGFYPDWIVLYKNGDIGIFDTKKGNTGVKESQTTRDKAKALHEKIDWLNHNSKLHYIGGILELDSAEWKNTSINLFNSKEN